MNSLQRVLLISVLALLIGTVAIENLFAQYFAFGKNRVQYEQFDWRYIETEHFDIYYYDSKNYHLAQFTAETLEPALKQLQEDLGSQLTDRIPVIIYDSHSDFSQTNVVPLPVDAQGIGGVTDKFKNRMTQPFMGDYADFRRTLHHELVHAYINDVYYGGNIQSIMQNNIQLVFPLWFEEGLAEYMAQGWDTQTDMFMRDAIINNYLPPLTQLGGFFAYRGGQSFWYFIEAEYGRQKITEIMQRVRTTRNIRQSLVQSLGLSIEEISNRWKEFYRQRYLPEVADRQTLSSVASQITTRARSGSYNTSPAISPNGDRIAMITNRRGVFDVVIVDANTGERQKTLIRGADNPLFEELNILNPNLTWSPDGSRIALSSKSQGRYNLAIVDVASGRTETIRFPTVDAMNSVAWSPDGKKIAFDGNIGPYQDIFVYNLETQDFQNMTGDIFTDKEPAWGPDSETIYFVSNRGSNLRPNTRLAGYSGMISDDFFQTDLYSIRVGSSRIERLTNTPNWSESQPTITRDGRMVFVSDQNGIPNIYEYDLSSRTVAPLTDLRSGVMQISISYDGSRLAFNALNEGFPDIFLMRSPFANRMDRQLTPNRWAQQRMESRPGDLVPALGYTQRMLANRSTGNLASIRLIDTPQQQLRLEPLAARPVEEVEEEEREEERQERTDRIDFRNYQFGEAVVRDTTIELRDDPRRFEPEDNVNEDGYYTPRQYRLQFSPDFSYAAGSLSTYYGTSAFAFFTLSDLFGDHRLSIGTNLVFDLRNSDYTIQYGYLRNRTNFFASFFHQSRNFQTFFGDLLRFRTYGMSIDFQYPFNRYQRVDYGISGIGISRDISSAFAAIGDAALVNERSYFLYPQVTFTADYTIPGFITPSGGSRYSLQLAGSPPLGVDSPTFATLLGDYRRYFNLGQRYTYAMRGAGAISVGPDAQTFFMGGMLGWLNQRWADVRIPTERLADTFFTLPATPVRGHRYNTVFGDKFTLINQEFRFPLFAAILPGPVPIIPLWNITGAAFLDIGTAWSGSLDFRVAEPEEVIIDGTTGQVREGTPQQGDFFGEDMDGDILIGAGFGLRTILLGLPFRYDIGWPYYRSGFDSRPIHYFSIGIDF